MQNFFALTHPSGGVWMVQSIINSYKILLKDHTVTFKYWIPSCAFIATPDLKNLNYKLKDITKWWNLIFSNNVNEINDMVH